MRRRATPRLVAVAICAALAASGCSASSRVSRSTLGFNPPEVAMARVIGPPETELDVVAWSGYADDGRTPGVAKAPWVAEFESKSGCKVVTTVAGTSDQMVALMMTGRYDAVSASGDATQRLIAGGDVAPVNTALVPNYAGVYPSLKDKPWNSVDQQMYGIPHGRGYNVLMYNTERVSPAPTSLRALFDPDPALKGKVSAYDSPIYIADAALYLMKTRPELGIRDPYALDKGQLDTVVALLKQQRLSVNSYWSDSAAEQAAFGAGSYLLGTSWPSVVKAVNSDLKVKVAGVIPTEGTSGWSDTWMVSSRAAHPNCAYEWLNWIIKPEVNAQVAESYGEAPATPDACKFTVDQNFCATYHASDEQFWTDDVHFWTTPTSKCLDGRVIQCTDYQEWITDWNAVRG